MADDLSAAVSEPGTRAESRQTLKPADPCAMVLFGATGDLANRLVVPALYNLLCAGILPADFALIGVARHESRLEDWRESLHRSLKARAKSEAKASHANPFDEAAWRSLADKMAFVQGDLADPALYVALREALDVAETKHRTAGNVIFYLAVTDGLFGAVAARLDEVELTRQGPSGWRRVVIEKPFGHSLESAQALNADLAQRLSEDQIFRIDHFLGKDTVQNIGAFRFANGLFEPLWNREHIDHVQITAAETLGVESRGEFYERTGALRDMTPNHLLSLVSLVAMEPPNSHDADSFRTRKADVLAAIPAVDPARAVRGQYDRGLSDGKAVSAYRDEPKVAARSKVETYAALELRIDSWRWAGVPFFVRTGKHLSGHVTEIAVRFKPAPIKVFEETSARSPRPNWLILRIAPDESISVRFEVRRRGPETQLVSAEMVFNYDDGRPRLAYDGYEALLYDVMIGVQTLFMRADMVEAGWRIVQPVLDAWADEAPRFPNYASGEAGPQAADKLIALDGDRAWRSIGGSAGPKP
jgi:glucose-6-phosphate 1-dehydrogenase